MTCTSEAELKAAKFHIGPNLGFSLFEFFTSRKILTLVTLQKIFIPIDKSSCGKPCREKRDQISNYSIYQIVIHHFHTFPNTNKHEFEECNEKHDPNSIPNNKSNCNYVIPALKNLKY